MKGFNLPRVSKTVQFTGLPKDKFEKEKYVENLKWENEKFVNQIVEGIKIDTGYLEGILMTGSKLDKLRLMDVKIVDSNLSNVACTNGNWLRTVLNDCKLTGLQLTESQLEDVLFENCNAQYMQMRFSNVQRVVFRRCDLKGADFEGTDFSGCELVSCDLSECEFSGCRMMGADLRGSNLEGAHLGPEVIKGAIVNTSQAMYLAGLMGIDIRD